MTHDNNFLAAMFCAYSGATVRNEDNSLRYTAIDLGITDKNIARISEVYKLSLTPLSAITDEDANYIAGLCGWDSKENILKCFVDDMGKLVLDFEMHTYKITITAEIIDFLRSRSRSYDVGFRHIPSLITAGLAINSQTL